MAYSPSIGAGGAAAAGAGAGSLFSNWQNPADSGMNYLDQMPAELQKYLGNYINAGNFELPNLENQYGNLTSNPGGFINQIGQGYHQSPGFQFSLQQALQGSNHAAAAGGMAGSAQHEQQNMGLATNLANQDYNQWLSNALGMYKTGLSGEQGLYNTGASTGLSMGEDLASILANKAKLAYEGQNAENEHEGGGWGAFLGGASQLGAAFL